MKKLLFLVENLPEVLEAKSNIGLSDFGRKVKSERGPKLKDFNLGRIQNYI